jgi:molybdopterin synthase catalytic subunit
MELELPEGATTSDALAALGDQPGLTDIVERMPLAVAVNREYAPEDHELSDGDEIALVPPVSGGSELADADRVGDATQDSLDAAAPSRIHARVVEGPISAEQVSALVGRPHAGAIVTFQGTTRDVHRLDYEAYTEMAAERMRAILADAVDRHELEAAAAEHRVGRVPLGEASVVVAVSAAHRAEAFAGAREAIDRIKAEAPIWKREVEVTGAGETASWVEGALPSAPVRPPTARAD